jgi:hypothetical protein
MSGNTQCSCLLLSIATGTSFLAVHASADDLANRGLARRREMTDRIEADDALRPAAHDRADIAEISLSDAGLGSRSQPKWRVASS